MQKATFTVYEAAEYIGVGRNTMYKLVKEKNFPSIRIKKQIRIPIKALDQWLETEAAKELY